MGAARIVLNDWNSGKLKYFTHPPQVKTEMVSTIVQEFSKDFSLDDLETVEAMDFSNLPQVRPSEMVEVETGQIHEKAEEMVEMVEMEEDEDDENDENILPTNVEVFANKGKKAGAERKGKEDPLFLLEGNQKVEKIKKLEAKKRKKDLRRRDRVAETLSNQMDDAFSALTS